MKRSLFAVNIQVHIYNWLIRNRSFSRSAIAKVQFLYLYYASFVDKYNSDLRHVRSQNLTMVAPRPVLVEMTRSPLVLRFGTLLY